TTAGRLLAEMSHFGTTAFDPFDQTPSALIRRSASFWPAGSTPASRKCRAAWRRAQALSTGTYGKTPQGKLLLPASKAIAVMPVPAARRHDLKVQALAEGHASTIANQAIFAAPCAQSWTRAP